MHIALWPDCEKDWPEFQWTTRRGNWLEVNPNSVPKLGTSMRREEERKGKSREKEGRKMESNEQKDNWDDWEITLEMFLNLMLYLESLIFAFPPFLILSIFPDLGSPEHELCWNDWLLQCLVSCSWHSRWIDLTRLWSMTSTISCYQCMYHTEESFYRISDVLAKSQDVLWLQ